MGDAGMVGAAVDQKKSSVVLESIRNAPPN